MDRDAIEDPRRGSLDDDLELAMVERSTTGILDLHQTLAQALLVHLSRPMIAHRVIAGAAHKGVRRPGAAGHAGFRIIAGAAKAPQVVDRSATNKGERIGVLPDVPQARLPDIAPGVRAGHTRARFYRTVSLDPHHRVADRSATNKGERIGVLPDVPQARLPDIAPGVRAGQTRARLYRTVSLDPHHRVAGIAAVEVDLVVDDIPDDGFIRAIIADGARRLQEETAFTPFHGELREQRHDLEHLPRLEQQVRMIGGIAPRRHDRPLPIACAGIFDDVA